MIIGNADIDALAKHAAKVERFSTDPVDLPGTEILQATFEMPSTAREGLLPPGLHPTIPAVLSLQVWKCPETPWGPVAFALARATCRSGVRARGFVLAGYTDNPRAGDALSKGWGLPLKPAEVHLRRNYDESEGAVVVDGQPILAVTGLDPEPMGPSDVQYTDSLVLAHTPNGLRLVQIEADHAPERVERIRPRLDAFEAAAWGDRRIDPYYPVAATITMEHAALKKTRFVLKPDELAFQGTERVDAA